MGRHANPIISKHYTRGSKLGDASNRYEWTCKQCGEHFPKGRIDGLYGHLSKTCTALSFAEKSNLAMQIHELGLAANAAGAATAERKTKLGESKEARVPTSKPTQEDFNGLNMLAEVSSQAVETQYGWSASSSSGDNMEDEAMVLDPTLENESFRDALASEVVGNGHAGRHGSSSSEITRVDAVPLTSYSSQYPSESLTTSFPSYRNGCPTFLTSDTEAANLTYIASSAGANLASSMMLDSSNVAKEKQHLPRRQKSLQKGHLDLQQSAATFPRSIAMKPANPTIDLGRASSQESPVPKPKGKAVYSEARKQDLRKMREIGSCIRCRMLKKTCSASDPCSTCGAIDSARAWKGFPCIRTKLAHMYQGYMLGLNQTLSSRDIAAVKSRRRFVNGYGELHITYFEDGDPIVLRALEGRMTDFEVDPALSMMPNGQKSAVIIVDIDISNLPKIFEEYTQKEATRFFEQEASPVIKSIATRVYQSSRNSDDVLPKSIINLWLLTTMLADSTLRWKASADSRLEQASSSFDYVEVRSRFPINASSDKQSYDLIYSQLQSGLERLATKLSTHAISNFEKRMMRPVTTNQFETYLAAILLINCFERHLWIFHSWIDGSNAGEWSLDASPADLTPQAAKVANMMAFMTTIRNLTPVISETTPGSTLGAEHPATEKYAQWFEEVGLTIDFLAQRKDAVFDTDLCCSLDLKYSASLLHPQPRPRGA